MNINNYQKWTMSDVLINQNKCWVKMPLLTWKSDSYNGCKHQTKPQGWPDLSTWFIWCLKLHCFQVIYLVPPPHFCLMFCPGSYHCPAGWHYTFIQFTKIVFKDYKYSTWKLKEISTGLVKRYWAIQGHWWKQLHYTDKNHEIFLF